MSGLSIKEVTRQLFDALGEARKEQLRSLLNHVYDTRDWARIVMYEACDNFLQELPLSQLDALEISSGRRFQKINFRSYTETNYPDFDICNDILDKTFDIIIADQVFEHLVSPAAAAKNVFQMLKPDGYFIITVPFMLRVHLSPTYDCYRWTEDGLRFFLTDAGFSSPQIQTGAWGNPDYIRAHLSGKWPRRGFRGMLKNDPRFPVVVWAFAQK